MSDKIVKQHDPNCSFLKVDIETDPTMRSSYGCDCGLHSVADEVTMGDAWMSGPEDFTKGIEEQINKYREMFPDSPIHILGTVIPPLNTEKAEPRIKLTFYSGKLWHSDKPFPVKPDSKDYTVSALYQADTNYYHNNILPAWLSTAYEVVNPEVIKRVDRIAGSRVLVDAYNQNKPFKDGDQITLPNGYGIKTEYQVKDLNVIGGWLPISKEIWTKNKAEKRIIATITLPETDYSTMITPEMNERLTKPITSFSEPSEKTKNSAHGQHCGGLNCPAFEYACADVCMRPIIKPVSEPSESQEEKLKSALVDCILLLEEVHKDFNCLSRISLGKIDHYREKFTITRK